MSNTAIAFAIVGGLVLYLFCAALTASLLGEEDSDATPFVATFWPIALAIAAGVKLGRRLRK